MRCLAVHPHQNAQNKTYKMALSRLFALALDNLDKTA